MTRGRNPTDPERSGPLEPGAVAQYHRDGYLVLPPEFLQADVVGTTERAMPAFLADDSPRRILERDGTTVRSVYGLHQSTPAISDLTRLPALLGLVGQILGDEVYVHQSKVNIKAPLSGDQWEWHQDYIYWLQGDGLQRPDLVNVAIFLDEVTEFNGPLTFIPGSHRNGVLVATRTDGMPMGYEDAPAWVATLTAEEQFKVPTETIEELTRGNGLVSPKGPAGSILLFHPNLLHSSAQNISPFRRAMLILVYNAVGHPRPPFLAEPDVAPLRPLAAELTGEPR
jgi:ectoine hydroxylase